MQHKLLTLIAVVLTKLGLVELHAQEAIPIVGGNASGNGGSATYSVGQMVYTTNTGNTGSIAQGVQQPYEISIVTAIEETKGIALTASVFPNPTAAFITLKVETYKVEKLSYQLYDINGKLIESKKIESNETSIAMDNLKYATYFLKVTDGSKEIKSFKIIKN